MEEKQYHIACRTGDVGRYCILPGDPGRCEKIARLLKAPQKMAQNREFTTYTGLLGNERVSVVSTGIGGPSAAIALEELVAIGADTFIRIGTCGGIDLRVKSGDSIVVTGAVRQEGTTREYAPIAYPATANFQVATALKAACLEQGQTVHTGVIQSKDSFYGQHSPRRMPLANTLLENWEALKRLHVLGSEMETAALLVVAASLDVRCGSILHVLWNQERRAAGNVEEDSPDTHHTVAAAVRALELLIQSDRGEGRA